MNNNFISLSQTKNPRYLKVLLAALVHHPNYIFSSSLISTKIHLIYLVLNLLNLKHLASWVYQHNSSLETILFDLYSVITISSDNN